RTQLVAGRVRRAVVDEDHLKQDATIERAHDLVEQRPDIVGLVAHGHDNRDSWRHAGAGLGIAHRVGFYGGDGPRATPLATAVGRFRPFAWARWQKADYFVAAHHSCASVRPPVCSTRCAAHFANRVTTCL